MTIRKLGYIDSARSHVQGLLPYVVLDEQGKPKVVYLNPEENDEDSNGNFKQYVCDFGKKIENYDPCAELTDEEKVYGNNPGRIAGTDMVIEQEKGDVDRYLRFKFLDLNKSYIYAKKQIREGILVKYLGKHEVMTVLECDGSPRMVEKEVWSYKFEGNPEPYAYTPFNYYGNDENKHRTVENYSKEGDYGLIFTNENTEDKPTVGVGEFALLVGASMDENGTIYPNQDKVYKRDEESDPNSVYWEYPDTAGKIKSDSKKWVDFGVGFFGDEYWAVCKDMEEKFIGYLNIPQEIEGDLVPDRISYLDIPEWIDWFRKHTKESCCYEKVVDGDNNNVGNVVDKEWTDRGGDEMKEFLERNEGLLKQALMSIKNMSCEFLVPNMEFPLLLTNEYRDTGLWTEYVDENGDSVKYEDENGNPKPHYYKDKCGETKVKPETEPLYAKWEVLGTEEEENALRVESQLQTVRLDDYQSDDNGVIPGVFEKEDGFYKCIYRHYYNYIEISEWSLTTEEKNNATEVSEMPELNIESITPLPILKFVEKKEDDIEIERYFKGKEYEYIKAEPSGKMKECHDDESSVNNNSYYFTATVVEEGKPILKTLKPDLVDGDWIHILAKYKAYETDTIYGYRSYLMKPYKEKEVHNFYKIDAENCFGDYIIDIYENDNGQLVIAYNIGGKCDSDGNAVISTIDNKENRGVILQDVYRYEKNHLYSFCFEGYDGIEIEGEYIDFDNSPNTIKVENYDLGTAETNENSEDVFVPKTRKCNQAQILGMRLMDALDGSAPKVMFKQPETEGIEFPIKSDVDIELNRGASAAFENYFKLSECNTMQDLENYQNNWFNL